MFGVDQAWVDDVLVSFDRRGYVFVPYNDSIISLAKAGSAYGNSFIHPQRAQRLWSASPFTVLEHISGGLRGWQDIYVLRRD
jgi:hypothetical protein